MKNYIKNNYKTIGTVAAVIVVVAGFFIGAALTSDLGSNDPGREVDTKLGTKTNDVEHRVASSTSPDDGVVTGTQKDCVLKSILSAQAKQYISTVKNVGVGTCKNVSYSVYYSDEEVFVSAIPRPTASDYYWKVGSLKKNEAYSSVATMNQTSVGTEMCASADNGKDSCVTSSFSTPVPPTPIPPVTVVSEEYGIWEWDSVLTMTSGRMDEIVSSAKAGKFNTIYLTIDDELVSNKVSFTSALAKFVSKANAQGIFVYAEWGWRDWAKPENRNKAFTLVDYVKEYNKTNPKIKAIQSDVEPYLLPEYENDKVTVLTDFVTFVDQVAQRLSGSGIGFSVVIPHFYDSKNNWTPKITYNGKTTYAFDHLLDILNKTDNNSLVIMAYRDTFEGSDGVDGIARQEVSQGGKTKIIVAQETGNVEPGYVTFFGQSKTDLASQIVKIRETYKGYQGFGGTAVHYLDPYLQLK